MPPLSDPTPLSQTSRNGAGNSALAGGQFAAVSSARAHVEALAGEIGPRPAGSDQEQRAAHYVLDACAARGIAAVGVPVDAPSLECWPELICLTGSLLALLVGLYNGEAGVALTLLVAGLYISGFLYHRRVLAALPSQRATTVVAIIPARRADARRLIVVAGLDSPRGGMLAADTVTWVRAHFSLLVASSVVLAALATVAHVLIDAQRITLVVLLPALALAVLLALSGEREWHGNMSPGAISNASSVAAMLDAGDRLQAGPADWVEVWLLALAARQPGLAGMRAFLDANHFDADTTLILSLESVGAGALHYAVTDGALRPRRAAPSLARLVSAGSDADSAAAARPLARLWLDTPATLATMAGYQALTIAGCDADGAIPLRGQPADLPDRVDLAAIQRAAMLTLGTIAMLDEELVERQRVARLVRGIGQS
jgi:hypothetical protein